MMKSLKKICIILVFGGLLGACGDEDLTKFGNIEGIKNWYPNFAIPIANATYDVWGLVDQHDPDANIVLKDGKIVIRYEEDSIYGFEVNQILTLPSSLVNLGAVIPLTGVTPGMTIPDGGLDLTFPSTGSKEEMIDFHEGEISKIEGSALCHYVLPGTGFTYKVRLTLDNIFKDGMAVVKDVNVGITGEEGDWDLSEVLFDMSAQANKVSWKLEVTIDGGQVVANVSDLQLDFELKNVTFTRVEGDISPLPITIDAGNFDLNIDFWNNFDGEFGFNDAKIDMTVTNYGLAVPMSVNMAFTAYDGNKHKDFAGGPLRFNGWVVGGAKVVETQGYDKSNSNINELLSLPPKDRITYGGTITVNPEHNQVTVLNDGAVKVGAYLEIPLDLQAKNLYFNDTIDADINENVSDKILEAAIRVTAKNSIPLELRDGNLLLLDENYTCLDSIKVEKFIDAPAIGADGGLTPAQSNNLIRLTQKNIQHIDGTKYIVIQVKALTSNNGEVPVVIKPDAVINLSLQLEAKVNGEEVMN